MTALVRLSRLSLASIARQPIVVGALLLVPAVLVIVAADGLNRFGEVVGMSAAHHGGHADHFTVLTAMWASGIAAAVVAAVTLTESAPADARVASRGGSPRWLAARLVSFCVVIALAATISVGMAVLRGADAGFAVWAWTLATSALYVLVAVAVSRFTADPLVVVGVVSGVWILDALTSPTMGSDAAWKAAVSPYFAAERAAMGLGSTWQALAVTLAWLLVLGIVVVVAHRLHPTPADPSVASTPARALTAGVPAEQGRLTAVRLLVLDLVRHRTLVLFAAMGPLGLMLSSLWLFQGVQVVVPVVRDGQAGLLATTMPELHATYMGLIAVVSFGGTAGYLVGAELHAADRRLGQASGRRGVVRAVRIAALGVLSLVVCASALAPMLLVRQPEQWGWFIAAHIGAAFTFTVLGYGAGLVLDRVTGLMVMMLFPFIDVGIAQDYMLGPVLPEWGAFLPARPFAELVIGAGFGEVAEPLHTGLWATAILVAVCLVVAVLATRGRQRT